jgi:acyl-CoA synthetase (AMP-forming)/AMP-acid ligase II
MAEALSSRTMTSSSSGRAAPFSRGHFIRALRSRFSESRDATLLVDPSGAGISYGRFWAEARRVASGWARLGARPGERVALLVPRGPGGLLCYLACALGGFVACPLDRESPPTDIDEALRLIGPALAIRDTPQIDAKAAADSPGEFEIDENDRDFLVIMSSGTTGKPKGILLALDAFLGGASSFASLWGIDPSTRLYHVFPSHYMAGVFNQLFCPLMAGGTVVLGPQFSPTSFAGLWTAVSSHRVNALCLSPSMAAMLVRLSRDSALSRRCGEQVPNILCTAGPPLPGLRDAFRRTFGTPLRNCYGITELGGSLTIQTREGAETEDDAGPPMAELELAFRPSISGKTELWARSPYMMRGYLTEQGIDLPVDAAGLFPTGDLAEMRGGSLCITGRRKDLIIRGGHNVNPAVIENALSAVAGVREVSVLGLPHEFWGEMVVACIVPETGISESEIRSRVERRCGALDARGRPDRIMLFEHLPKTTGVGKVLKRELARMLLEPA